MGVARDLPASLETPIGEPAPGSNGYDEIIFFDINQNKLSQSSHTAPRVTKLTGAINNPTGLRDKTNSKNAPKTYVSAVDAAGVNGTN